MAKTEVGPSAPQEPSTDRRGEILAAATRVFARKSLREARMEEIAAEAGLSVGGLYWYYKGKNELVAEMLASLYEADLEAVAGAAAEGLPALERFAKLVSLMEEKHVRTRSTLRVALEFCQTAMPPDQVEEGWRKHAGVYRSALRRVLADAKAEGVVGPIDEGAAADAIWGAFDGLNILWMIDPRGSDFAASFRLMADLLLRGARP